MTEIIDSVLDDTYVQALVALCTIIPIGAMLYKRLFRTPKVDTRSEQKIDVRDAEGGTAVTALADFEIYTVQHRTHAAFQPIISLYIWLILTMFASSFIEGLLKPLHENAAAALSLAVFLVGATLGVRTLFRFWNKVPVVFNPDTNSFFVFNGAWFRRCEDLSIHAFVEQRKIEEWHSHVAFVASELPLDTRIGPMWIHKHLGVFRSREAAAGASKPLASIIAKRLNVELKSTHYELNKLGRILNR